MAGSHKSQVLREQWTTANDAENRRNDLAKERSSFSNRGRHKDKYRGREGRFSTKQSNSFHRPRSPPHSGSRGAPDAFPDRRDLSPAASTDRTIFDSRAEARYHQRKNDPFEKAPQEHAWHADSPFDGPPPKRARTRSPSPQAHHPISFHRQRPPKYGGPPNHSALHKKRGRGSFNPRIARKKDRRETEAHPPSGFRAQPHDSPISRDPIELSPYRLSRNLQTEEERSESRFRSPHRISAHSRVSRRSLSPFRDSRNSASMIANPVVTSAMEGPSRSPSLRPRSTFEAHNSGSEPDGDTNVRETLRLHGDDSVNQRRPLSRQIQISPRYSTPHPSYHGSPASNSPYSGGRGGRNGQSSHHRQRGLSHSPPYRRNSHSSQNTSQSPYYQDHQAQYNGPSNHGQSTFSGPAYRGGHSSGHRGNHQSQNQEDRFPDSSYRNYNSAPARRGGHFRNLQWNAPGSRGRAAHHSPRRAQGRPSQSPDFPPRAGERGISPAVENGGDFITDMALNKDYQAESSGLNPDVEYEDSNQMPPPVKQPTTSETPTKGGKFSFAFKSKAAPGPAPKPVPDLAQRMHIRDPPQRPAGPSRGRVSAAPPPKFKNDGRFDRRDHERERPLTKDRDRGHDRKVDRERDDHGDIRDPKHPPRGPKDRRDLRKDDRRLHWQQQPREERLFDVPDTPRQERHPKPSRQQMKTITRTRPRAKLDEEFMSSDSVYFRKPGNESVIGAGTYGKVFKAIHIYTQKKVALKKIRMEGEKDGYPVTAVREIKLLQHLRNDNVVSLLEVMVEKNECFMVFEYLSHDLTGLINHPSFTLTAAHKKDLAKQMFEGLKYLHHRGVLHRDIKAANILISNRGQLKFADFGLARFFSKSRQLDYTNRVITIWYRPPELLLGETRYGPAVDIWSAACVYVEMFTKKAVFPGDGGEISQLEKLYNCLGTPTRADWPDIVEMPWFELLRPTERRKRIFEDVYRDVLTPAALDLVAQMLRYDPAKRPSAEEVLIHPYFTSEEPDSQQAIELENIEGDWHEFESKALRKERDREARRAEQQKEKEKRKAESVELQADREPKRAKQEIVESEPYKAADRPIETQQ